MLTCSDPANMLGIVLPLVYSVHQASRWHSSVTVPLSLECHSGICLQWKYLMSTILWKWFCSNFTNPFPMSCKTCYLIPIAWLFKTAFHKVYNHIHNIQNQNGVLFGRILFKNKCNLFLKTSNIIWQASMSCFFLVPRTPNYNKKLFKTERKYSKKESWYT